MAAIVCHGLQSHLESQLVDSRTLMFRLPSPKPLPSQTHPIDLAFKSCLWDSNIKTHQEENNIKTDTPLSSNPNKGGWNFLEALSNVSSQGTKESSSQYVHPQQKRSSLVLSPRSLEMCTENLGNESGTDIGIDMLSSSDYAGGNIGGTREPRQHFAAKKGKAKNFPPPLTTIRGSESVCMRPHREDGRLVIEVTHQAPPTASCFHAERNHGRLRLCFLNNHILSFDPDEEEEEEEEEEDSIWDNETTTNEGFEEEFESEMDGQMQDEEEEEEEEETEDVDVGCECEMRMEKYERPRRCKGGGCEHENNETLLNWGEPFWVVTS